jgi:hypothetical protein
MGAVLRFLEMFWGKPACEGGLMSLSIQNA